MNQIGERLKSLRLEKGLSQQELSDALAIGRSALSNYEQGIREPNLEILDLFANYFNVDMNFLTGYSDKKLGYSNTVVTERVFQRLKDLNMSLDEFYVKISIDKNTIIKNMQLPSFDLTESNIIALANILNTTPNFIKGYDEYPDNDFYNFKSSNQQQTLKVIRRASDKMDTQKLNRMVDLLKAAFPEEMSNHND